MFFSSPILCVSSFQWPGWGFPPSSMFQVFNDQDGGIKSPVHTTQEQLDLWFTCNTVNYILVLVPWCVFCVRHDRKEKLRHTTIRQWWHYSLDLITYKTSMCRSSVYWNTYYCPTTLTFEVYVVRSRLYTDYWFDYFSIWEIGFSRTTLKPDSGQNGVRGVCSKYCTCCFHLYWKQPVTNFPCVPNSLELEMKLEKWKVCVKCWGNGMTKEREVGKRRDDCKWEGWVCTAGMNTGLHVYWTWIHGSHCRSWPRESLKIITVKVQEPTIFFVVHYKWINREV